MSMQINKGASAVAALLLGVFGANHAGRAQDAPPPVIAPAVKPAAPSAATSEPTEADLALFKRAVARVRASKGISVKSEFGMNGAADGMTIAYKQAMTVVGVFPDKFRADIQVLNSDGTPGAKYVVVGDGLKAWTFRPGTNQYRVRSLSAFRAANDDMPSLGILCGMVSSVPAFGDLAMLKLGGGSVQMSEDANDAGVKTFLIGLGKGGPAMTLSVDPQTGVFTKLSIGGKEAKTTFAITETVSDVSDATALAPDLFVWAPPAGAVKVAALPIGPF